jgi:hypothetical protein
VTIATEIATIWGFVYALPNFIKQLRMQNASETAGNALALLPQLRHADIRFISTVEKDRDKAIEELIALYLPLQGHLKLLKTQPSIQKHLSVFETKLNTLLSHDKGNDTQKKYLYDAFGSEWYDLRQADKSTIKVNSIDDLEKDLNIIFNYADTESLWVKDFLMLVSLSVLYLAIRTYIFPWL